MHEYYGSANLTDRSRSPSPSSTADTIRSKRPARRLPATPQKPQSLNLKPQQNLPPPQPNMPHVIPSPTIPQPHKSPGSINFPRLSASPTHRIMNIPPDQNPHHPGRGMIPYSPTEKNDLNQPGIPLDGRDPRSSHRYPDHDRPPRFQDQGQILNNQRPQPPHYTDRERDNRFRDNRFGAEGSTALGRPGGGRPIVPNGYKPGQGMRGDRTGIHGRPNPVDIIRGGADDDSDDDDWC